MTKGVVTRFAPSPTGFLHIGGARTALFNWLYARGRGGRMLLRIEDTDRKRSTKEAIDAILDGMRWLGLEWDDEPVYQHTRVSRHQEVVSELLEKGLAYRCYATPEELEEMRNEAHAEGRTAVYNGLWRDRDPADAPASVEPAVRFKGPKDGETVIDDQVMGTITVANKDLDDLIIQRSDGTPTYNLAVVVDDHDMGVTHAIRGADHLTNASRQAQIYEALGWEAPVFAHVPLIHGPDGAKLSKRHGALSVQAYRTMGYLPEALRNYLVRLGWSHGDDEIFSTDQMIEWFDLPQIGRSPARFDFDKLENLNAHYIRQGDDQALADCARALVGELSSGECPPNAENDEAWEKLVTAMPGLKERAKTVADILNSGRFVFVARPLDFDDKAKALLDADGRAVIQGLVDPLSAIDVWSVENIENAVRQYAERADLKLGKIAQPLRAALTGRTVSPGIFDVVFALGKDEAIARIVDQAG
ncbi:MAG: glutamate--tRNA ligase [Hyphomicrobiaceae bacterium]|nr:glutamate--tRNA ligase [Hyphomicrobiaceae bacterium]